MDAIIVTGSKKTCVHRETLTIAVFALDEASGTVSISAAGREKIWSTPARRPWVRRPQRRTCRRN
jgi:hypothetical protein